MDADALKKRSNLLEDCLFVHNFSNRENITFVLIKDLLHVQHWWETYWEKISREESGIFGIDPTLYCFMDVVKEKYYLVENYDDQYMRWSMLHQKRDQKVM
jgi:hypothetical protein